MKKTIVSHKFTSFNFLNIGNIFILKDVLYVKIYNGVAGNAMPLENDGSGAVTIPSAELVQKVIIREVLLETA